MTWSFASSSTLPPEFTASLNGMTTSFGSMGLEIGAPPCTSAFQGGIDMNTAVMKWSSCEFCKVARQKCSAIQDIPAIVDEYGKVVEAAGSWKSAARGSTTPKAKLAQKKPAAEAEAPPVCPHSIYCGVNDRLQQKRSSRRKSISEKNADVTMASPPKAAPSVSQ